MMEEKFESDDMKAEVIKLLCSGQDGSQTSKSENSIQNPVKSENSIQNPPLRYNYSPGL